VEINSTARGFANQHAEHESVMALFFSNPYLSRDTIIAPQAEGDDSMTYDAYQEPQKSWWGRNWIWVVPLGCLTPFLLIGGCAALVFFFVVPQAMQMSEPYIHAVRQAQSNQEVKAILGEPIQVRFVPNGQFDIKNQTGKANFSLSISGPKKSGTIYVVATETDGKWEYSKLEFAPEGSDKRIDLRSQPAKEEKVPAKAAKPIKDSPKPPSK
jgi:hypothetical protein